MNNERTSNARDANNWRGIFSRLIILPLAASALLTITAQAQLSSANVSAIAIYVADVNTSDSLTDTSVNYNITSPGLIDSILSGIEFNVQRDCTGIESKNSAYFYVNFKDGTRKV